LAFQAVRHACEKGLNEIEKDDDAARSWLKRLPLPENIRLPRTSDAEFFYDMFTPRQLAGLALIKHSIDREAAGVVRDLLLLAWSASVAKLNRTFLSAKGRAESRGGSSIFSIYRYKLASQCVELPIWDTFHGRYRNVLAAKEEVLRLAYYRKLRSGASAQLNSAENFKVLAYDAGTLDEALKPGSVDYIFTDPPYGGFITYLDLSILWNHGLGFQVSDGARESETIVGGEREHSQEHYKKSLACSIKTGLQLLRPDRWFSVVFQHWDISYFAAILETASECGAELRAAITQTGDVIWSMHKKKNSASVLAGEMILTFFKPKRPPRPLPAPKDRSGHDPAQVLSEVFDVCLANGMKSFTSEALFNRLIVELWRRRELACLTLDRDEFSGRLEQRGWTYNPKTHLWSRGGNKADGPEELALIGA
jgi:hypothetical protein